MSHQDFTKRFVKCKREFIEKYSLLKNSSVNFEKIKCESVIDIFSQVLSTEQLDNINSLSFTSIHGEYTQVAATCENDVIPILVDDYTNHCSHKRDILESLSKRSFKFNKEIEEKNNKTKTILKNEIDFYNNIIKEFYNINKSISLENFKENFQKHVENFNQENTKIFKLKNFFDTVKSDASFKVLLFSDHTNSFNAVKNIIEKSELKYTDLGKGNIKEINTAITDFKEKDTQVLMIDSSSQGCGINLENATHVVFLHKTLDTLYEQIIGRALRPGRTKCLEVKMFLNENEII